MTTMLQRATSRYAHRHRRRVLSCLALAGVLWLPVDADARGRREGDEVLVTGVVTDARGKPVPGTVVELRATRRAFTLRNFRVTEQGTRTAATSSDAEGAFEIRWVWHPYYNRFQLVAGVTVGRPGGEGELYVLDEVDLSNRMKRGNPIDATMQLESTSLVVAMREFLASVDSDDERRVYQELGKPDKVRHTPLQTHTETSWWYFERGTVYRFRDGKIDTIEHFEPVRRFSE